LHIDPDQLVAWQFLAPTSSVMSTDRYLKYRRFYTTLVLLEYMQWSEAQWDGANARKKTFGVDIDKSVHARQ
jgi:hypothetical protein